MDGRLLHVGRRLSVHGGGARVGWGGGAKGSSDSKGRLEKVEQGEALSGAGEEAGSAARWSEEASDKARARGSPEQNTTGRARGTGAPEQSSCGGAPRSQGTRSGPDRPRAWHGNHFRGALPTSLLLDAPHEARAREQEEESSTRRNLGRPSPLLLVFPRRTAPSVQGDPCGPAQSRTIGRMAAGACPENRPVLRCVEPGFAPGPRTRPS